uniref:Cytochrome P450 704C1-like n=1 Tax=Nelumbo nucifera TaxID=4432 RepID=A0A822XMM6_NELNU|nr:TPA_asm: hypothetical protein HUJ06_022755 [Nelumbo nucifera]
MNVQLYDPKGILKDDVLPDGTKLKAGGMVTYVPYFKDGFFHNSSPFKFTAFQAAPRICLGKDSAYLQMKMTLAILCRFFKYIQDDDNSINGTWTEAHCNQTLLTCHLVD